jgi:hypothetical protein
VTEGAGIEQTHQHPVRGWVPSSGHADGRGRLSA